MTSSLKNKILVFENMHNQNDYPNIINENVVDISEGKKDLSSIYYRIKNRKDLHSMSRVISETSEESKVSTIVGMIDKQRLEDIIVSISSCIDVCFKKKVLIISYQDIGKNIKDITLNEASIDLKGPTKRSLNTKKLSENISVLNYSYFLSLFVGNSHALAGAMKQITSTFDKVIFLLDDKELTDLGVDDRAPILLSSHCDFIVRERKTRLSTVKKSTEYLKSLGVKLGGVIYAKEEVI
ncbi:hypothetical protein [Halobacteriovorax sp.]|uniref:hypothetical protein n=1 Tax=Halobacteriovorax sp. TaxID=2020862 RepID=UPI003AF260A4